MPLIEGLFVIPRNEKEEKPNIRWAYKRRGFNEQSSMTGERDTFAYPLGVHGMEYKKELAAMMTGTGKNLRVYEMQELNYPSATRQVYLDGVLKSNSVGQAAAHESAVHPPMLAHDAPKRVVIFGVGLGASTREVLKHKTVEEVTVVGADRAMVDFSKKYLPEWSDCSYASKDGSETNCFDDSRVHFVYDQSPSEWIASHSGAPYDVALVDLFDMEEEFATEIMSNRQHTVDQLFNTLSDSGVISFNLAGSSKVVESMTKSGMTPTRKILRSSLAQELKNIGFAEIFAYDEYRSGFSETRSYVVAFKDAKVSKNWNANQAETKLKLKDRVIRNQSTGEVSLEFFDAATMATYSKFSSSSGGEDMKEILTLARNNAHQAVEQSAGTANKSNQQGVNSSCSNLEGSVECENPTIKVSEGSGESWSTRDAVRES
jgi:spermidine synthase